MNDISQGRGMGFPSCDGPKLDLISHLMFQASFTIGRRKDKDITLQVSHAFSSDPGLAYAGPIIW